LYLPSDDSVLLANCLKDYSGNLALDIGAGSGIITHALCENFEHVVGTDLVFEMLRNCKKDAVSHTSEDSEKMSKNDKRFELVCADAASAFRSNTFDLIVSNPPYLPDDYNNEGRRVYDRAIYGGESGIEVTINIIRSSLRALKREGSLLIIVSNLSDTSQLHALLHLFNLSMKKIVEKRLFFETLSVVEIRF
jgi:release factor glutamine methyltransferase